MTLGTPSTFTNMGDKLVVLYLVVALSVLNCPACSAQRCSPSTNARPEDFYMLQAHQAASDDPGSYLYLGGVFDVHEPGGASGCGSLSVGGFQNAMAFHWAVLTYKTRHPGGRLQDLQLGALAFDTCGSSYRMMQQVLNFERCVVGYGSPGIDPDSLLAYVGPGSNDQAKTLASHVSNSGPTLVSYAATSPVLANRAKYPFFLRTVPPDTEQYKAILKLLTQQEWKHVQLVYSVDQDGMSGYEGFRKLAEAAGVCLVHSEVIKEGSTRAQLDATIRNLKIHSKTRAVVLLADEITSRDLMLAAKRENVRGTFTWIGTTAWAKNNKITDGLLETAEGAVTLSMAPPYEYDGYEARFKDYLQTLNPVRNPDNPWLKEYWVEALQCYFAGEPNPKGYGDLCTPQTTSLPSTTEMDAAVPYTIEAADAILHGIEDALKTCPRSGTLCNRLRTGNFRAVIYDNIQNIERPLTFRNSTGNPVNALYRLNNLRRPHSICKNHCYSPIGTYSTVVGLSLTTEVYSYDSQGKRLQHASSGCGRYPCTECGEFTTVPTPLATTNASDGASAGRGGAPPNVARLREESWVIPLIVLASVGILLVFVLEVFLLRKIFGSPFIKHWRTMWLGQLLLVAIFLCYLVLYAFILTPTKATCGIVRFGVGTSYAMCFAALLVKLMIILSSNSSGSLRGIFQFLMFVFAWGVQIVVDVEWLILRQPAADYDPGSKQWTCRYGGFADHVQSLVYVMFLIFICIVLSIRTRKIATNHREGVFIGMCAGFAVPIWVAWILVGMLNNAPEYWDPCLAFGLLATATIIVFVMYLPKVRQLNSMGVEGIYAEDDEVEYSPSMVSPASIVGGAPDSFMAPPGSFVAPPGSIIGPTGSLIAASVRGRSEKEPIYLVSNGGVYTEPTEGIRVPVQARPAQNALYLKHPGTHRYRPNVVYDTASVRSAPVGYILRKQQQKPTTVVTTLPPKESADPNEQNIKATTRVLKVTNDLTGRPRTPTTDTDGEPAVITQAQPAVNNHNVTYGTTRSLDRGRYVLAQNGTLKKARSITDLGAL